MHFAYFDTTALIRRYVEEPGRREVLRLLRETHCVISAVLPLEVRSALRRRAGEKTLDARRMSSILKRFAGDRAYWTVLEVSSEVLAAAEALSGAHPLRALDSIHVASAKLSEIEPAPGRSPSSAQTHNRAGLRKRSASRRDTSARSCGNGQRPAPRVSAASER